MNPSYRVEIGTTDRETKLSRMRAPRSCVIEMSVLDAVQIGIGLGRLELWIQGAANVKLGDADIAALESARQILADIHAQATASSKPCPDCGCMRCACAPAVDPPPPEKLTIDDLHPGRWVMVDWRDGGPWRRSLVDSVGVSLVHIFEPTTWPAGADGALRVFQKDDGGAILSDWAGRRPDFYAAADFDHEQKEQGK